MHPTVKQLNAFHLKVIAILAMTINHVGQVFEPYFHPLWWQIFYLTIGKLTFPIMAYLLVQGFQHTKSFPRYLGRLLAVAILSILPFHLALVKTGPFYLFNNVLFTLAIGLLMLKLISGKRPYRDNTAFNNLTILAAMLLTIKSDWNMLGVAIIWIFYEYSHNYELPLVIFVLVSTLIEYLGTNDIMVFTYLGILLVLPTLKTYNGQQGYSNNLVKYGFYLYYPLHLTILWFLYLVM